jgi:phosphatidylethanolamine N-methyltransferase
MTITRVAEDMSGYDTSRYSITVASSSSSAPVPRFHVGQPIRVNWTAPSNHSRKDWIGVYRLGSAKDCLITKISSMGKWVPIFEEEYNGEEQARLAPEQELSHGDAGTVTFRGNRLPWSPGKYELRYHHDGKHNVMSTVSPIEIYVSKPSDMHSFRAVHDTLLNIVCLALDSNVSLVPRSARQMASNVTRAGGSRPKSIVSVGSPTPVNSLGLTHGPRSTGESSAAGIPAAATADLTGTYTPPAGATAPPPWQINTLPEIPPSLEASVTEIAAELDGSHVGTPRSESSGTPGTNGLEEPLQDEDDFVVMNEKQAKHISQMAQWAFGVEINPDVVVADANVTALARRILGARNLEDGRGTPSVSSATLP